MDSLLGGASGGLAAPGSESQPPTDDYFQNKFTSEEVAFDSFKLDLKDAVENTWKQWGGPEQHLNERYPDNASKIRFGEELFEMFPMLGDINYQASSLIPSVKKSEVVGSLPVLLHVSSFSFASGASFQGTPDRHRARALLDAIIQKTFLTTDDPIRIKTSKFQLSCGPAPWVSVSMEDGIPTENPALQVRMQSVGYVSGNTRLKVLLSILSMCIDDKVNLKKQYYELWLSINRINCIQVVHANSRSEVFANFDLAYRFSMKKQPSILNWVRSLRSLAKCGDKDDADVVREWNRQATDASVIKGAKATALKLMLTSMPKKALDALDKHVSELSWDSCPWSDDSIRSKKHYPGYAYRCTTRKN